MDSYHSYDEQTRPGKYVGVGTTLSNMQFPQTFSSCMLVIYKISVPDSLDEAAEITVGLIDFQLTVGVFSNAEAHKKYCYEPLIINALWFWNDFMLPLLIFE